MTRQHTFGPRQFDLAGTALAPGDQAPDFTLVGRDNRPVTLSDFAQKTLILATVPSVDTAVCSVETQRWEQEVQSAGEGIAMLTVSMDLPFALRRFCGEHSVNHITASAHRDERFGTDYGVLMSDIRILSRAVFVIDPTGRIAHVEYVAEAGNEPDYGTALAAARALVPAG
ncbi:MAG: thiol peroxidase [Candidatus Dormibacteria bacterium]